MPAATTNIAADRAGANAPALVIRFALEARPVVYVDTLDRDEEARLTDWLTEARPDYGNLAARAMELAQDAQAR